MLGGLFGSPSNPKQGFQLFEDGKYAEALTFYVNSLQEYPDQRPHLNFNIAQCNLLTDSLTTALGFFSQAANIGRVDKKLSSLAWNQIGGLHASMPLDGPQGGGAQAQGTGPGEEQANPIEIALEDFKNALRMDPENDLARYNYELLKRKLQQQQDQQKDEEKKDENKDEKEDKENENKKDDSKQDKQDQNKKEKQEQKKPDNEENKGNQGKNQQEGEPSQEKMSMEQAKMLLEAMNQNEKMFLQQLQKAKQKKGPRNKGPEW
jgi:tetratricopeptide (TPR) repeat protein